MTAGLHLWALSLQAWLKAYWAETKPRAKAGQPFSVDTPPCQGTPDRHMDEGDTHQPLALPMLSLNSSLEPACAGHPHPQ